MLYLMKMILHNITAKPFRTVIIVICLAAASLTFSLSLAISVSSRAAVEEQVRSGNGRADIVMTSVKGIDELPALPEGCEGLPVLLAGSYFQIHDINNYKYVQRKNIRVLGVDMARARNFGILPELTTPNDGEAVISSSIARRYGYEIGDRLTLPCADATDITLTVTEIAPEKGLLSILPQTVIVTEDTARTVLSSPVIKATMVYLDAPDGRTSETAERLSEMYPGLLVQQLAETAESEDMVNSLTRTFFMLFVVTFLMILFIISAFAKNIAAERLAVIGTLRSIGAEKRTAAFVLLMECAVYGLLGGAVGTGLFYALKDALVGDMLFSLNGVSGGVSVPLYIPLAGLVLSAAISCVVSLAAVIRTSKTPIRDIIFGGKDKVFRPSNAAAIAGVMLIIGALIPYFSGAGFSANIAGLAALVVGICLVIPKLLSVISSAAARRTSGGTFPVLRLAVIQSGTKKTAVTGTLICTALLLLTAALFILSRSVDKLYSARIFDCDIIISNLSEHAERYELITAESKEFIYSTEEMTQINGKTASINIFGYDDFEMFSGIRDLPEALRENEIALDKVMMKRLGIKAGEAVTLTLKSDSVRPVTLTLTAVPGIDSIYYDQRCCAAMISLETYQRVYRDYPSMLLANGDAGLIQRQLIDGGAELQLSEEYYAAADEESRSVTGLLYALAIMGVLLAVISVSGEQMIGFSGRKHELAVLRSQGMSVGQLSKMLLFETALSLLLPILIFIAAGNFIVLFITKALGSLEMNIPISFEAAGLAAFIAAMSAAVTLTVLITIKSLKRMKVADELKRE